MDDIKYNVKTIINNEDKTDKEIMKLFNEKLLRLILSLENSNVCQV